MKIGQCSYQNNNYIIVVDESGVYRIGNDCFVNTQDLIIQAGKTPLTEYVKKLINKEGLKITSSEYLLVQKGYILQRPIEMPEAWAAGVTYRRQALEHDQDLRENKGKTDDLYQYVYENERVEVFFKGLSRSIVGSGEDLWLRGDSTLVMPEAELVLVIGNNGLPVAYTLGNDLTAWDIESECPLYLNQAKIWTGSGSVGPWIIPVESVTTPYDFNLRCVVQRGGKVVLNVTGSTSGIKRSMEELCHYMNYSNCVPPGTVLFTGTTCVIDHKFGLEKGDFVEISTPLIGALQNNINSHPKVRKDFPILEGEI